MEAVAYLDTHVVVWLYAGDLQRIPVPVRAKLETHALLVSPAVILELQYLFEIRRVSEPADAVISDLDGRIGLSVSDVPFRQVVSIATKLTWTRDPFDRLIVAQAKVQGAPLVTADGLIRRHYDAALWGRARGKT